MGTAPPLPAGATFREAADAVLRHLAAEHVGAVWAVTRAVDGRHEVVQA